MCYDDIERFKLTNKRNRKRAALHIIKTYLKPHAPLELNFQKSAQTYEQLIQLLETSPTIDTTFFDSIQWHCVEDMTDVFERLKNQSKKTRDILQQWREEAGIDQVGNVNNQQQELKNTMKLIDSMSSVPSTPSVVTSEASNGVAMDSTNSATLEKEVKSPESNL